LRNALDNAVLDLASVWDLRQSVFQSPQTLLQWCGTTSPGLQITVFLKSRQALKARTATSVRVV
jgi:hypothetical protein